MIIRANDNEFVQVRNMKDSYGIVILLPVTRVTQRAFANWKKVVQIMRDSGIFHLVVLDKTPCAEATEYFERIDVGINLDIHILRRPPKEPIYDSQQYVKISEGLWIIQLHDDDQWDGTLQIPIDAEVMEMFTTRFYLNSNNPENESSWEESPPARINFTLLPSRIWNQFSEMITDQGGHVAGSVDSTLDFISRSSCKVSHLSSFTYVYSNRHWSGRFKASDNLSALADQDGWSFMSSVDIQLLNRSIDQIAATEYFSAHLLSTRIDGCRVESFNLLALSRGRRLLISLRMLFQYCFLSLLNVLKNSGLGLGSDTNRNKIEQKILTLSFILQARNSNDKEELRSHIRKLRETNSIPRLEKRFIFWEELLSNSTAKYYE
jgi:hypothetical protein